MEDEKIVALFWRRSEEAIEETARRYGQYCHRIAYNILGNREDAEECVNDAYVHTWNAIPPQKPTRLAAFIGKITRHIALDRLDHRQAAKRKSHTDLILHELEECLPDGDSARDPADDIALKDAIHAFLSSLPARERTVFMRRYWYMYPIKSIARAEGLSESNVKTLLHRTRIQFKDHLRKEGIVI